MQKLLLHNDDQIRDNQTMIKAVIFDMDGLMVNTEPLQSRSFEEVIKTYGKKPVLNEHGLVHRVGVRGDKNFQEMKIKYHIDEELMTLRQKRRVVYEKLLQEGVSAMPGLFSLLRILQEKDIPIAIASGSPRKHITIIAQHLHISNYFTVVISGEDVKHGKPDPECFIKASSALGLPVEECLVIEDAESGVHAAKQIGMKVIAIPSEYTKHHNLKKADMIGNSLEEITWDLLMSL